MDLVATKSFTYRGRMLRHEDPFTASRRDGKVLIAIGRARLSDRPSFAPRAPSNPMATPKPNQQEANALAAPVPDKDELAGLRTEYESVIGKRPFMGWDAATLRDKIAAHQPVDTPADDQTSVGTEENADGSEDEE